MKTRKREICERYPQLANKTQPLMLADLPSPIQRLSALERKLGRTDLFIKRDDLNSTLYAGNKVRKLEFLLSQAKRSGSRTLLTMGGVGSNHLLACALHGNSLGLRTVGVVFDQPWDDHVEENQLADLGAGVELWPVGSKYKLGLGIARAYLSLWRREGVRPQLIPGGGSSPLGALGFVNAGLELGAQIRAGELPEPKTVVLPYGTGGTAVGLAIGFRLAQLRSNILAVRVIDPLLANRFRLERFCESVCRFLKGLEPALSGPAKPASNLEIARDYFGGGYGIRTEAANQAVHAFAEDKITLEYTYTGKAAAAFLDLAKQTKGALLFWNTFSAADISSWVAKGQTAK